MQPRRSGQGIIALNQSANRDEDVFDDPDRFDIRCVVKLPTVSRGHF
jgi:cytochrome P450